MALERPNLVFLMETKNKETMVDNVRRQLKFQNMFVEQLMLTPNLGLIFFRK